MSKSGHGAIPQGIPGWYVQFQSDILLQLPRPGEISEDVALGWHDSRGAMKKTLREALLPPDTTTEVRPLGIVIDCDVRPVIPSNLTLEGEGAEHRQMGKVTLEKRDDGKLYVNGVEVVRYLSPNQKNGKVIQGHKLRKELAGKRVLNACILDALLANPQLVPDEWKSGYTYFWGTIFRDADGDRFVGYLCWGGWRWFWDYRWLDKDWREGDPAASLAS